MADPISSSIAPALITGGISAIGGLIGNQANARQQNRSQDYMTEMSNTAHQREVADLRKAGLNPILSANKGASTPQSSPSKMENALGAGVTTALDTQRLRNETAALGSTIGLQTAQAQASGAQALQATTTAKNTELQSKALASQLEAIGAEAKTRKGQAAWDLDMQQFDNIQKRIQNGLNTGNAAKDLINPYKFGKQPGSLGKDQIIINHKTGEVIKQPSIFKP